MNDYEATATVGGLRVETIVNPLNGQPVKISETTTKRVVTIGDPSSFIAGYQHRLADEWNEQHAQPRQYTVRLRNGELLESFTAFSHSDQGEWIVFYDTGGETLMTIKQADVISIWLEPIETTHPRRPNCRCSVTPAAS